MKQRIKVVTIVGLLLLPPAGAIPANVPPPGYVLEDELPDLTKCTNKTVGDKVGYKTDLIKAGPPIPTPLGAWQGVWSLNYYASGLFEGGDHETIDGTRYQIWTIRTGYSRGADWCEGMSRVETLQA